ncbi:hypothetical protein [Collimonas sp.]|uniref:hypothetical protein n=1 Tax=Collimonas sp. TaxID=1963772 RepID=UPI002CE009AD|nr:hypothetical protein [Collimonas sp.]HWW03943.1 hypothetical protein [Collimonas sp.]
MVTVRLPMAPLCMQWKALSSTGTQGSVISEQDGTVTDTPNVQAAADGVYHLDVSVTIDDRTNAISIPVTVGNPRPVLKSTGKAIQTPRGETLMILPAQESSR